METYMKEKLAVIKQRVRVENSLRMVLSMKVISKEDRDMVLVKCFMQIVSFIWVNGKMM